MQARCHDRHDVASFAALAWPLLVADPVRHTDSLTVLDGLLRARVDPSRASGAAALLTVHDRGGVVGAVVRTAGRPALVSALRPEHADEVDRALVEADPELPGVTGPVDAATAFAAAHAARTGAEVRVDMRMRLFALAAAPATGGGVPGAVRQTTGADTELLAAWMQAFEREATRQLRDPQPPLEHVRGWLAAGDGLLFWEVDGQPVALAVARRPIAGMSRIGPVYTPPEHRGHGYGGVVTTAAARWAIEAGATRVVLFVDEANPTTNRLYPRLGFRPVHDAIELSFGPGGALDG